MSETPRDQRDLWHEVSRTFEELGEALRLHLSPDAARSPSDPTAPRSSAARPGAHSDGPVDPTETEPAAWADPARPGESTGFDDPWAAATDAPPRAQSTPTSGPAAAGTAGPGPGTNGTGGGGADSSAADAAAGSDPTAAGSAGPRATGAAAPVAGTTGTAGSDSPGADSPGAGTGATGTGPSGPEPGAGAAGGAGPTGAGSDGAGAGRERGWREWTGTAGGGRFAGPADWDSARESVRDLGSSVRRIATQAGDAARDPQVRDSAQRAARSLGDAIVTTVEDLAAELRERMRTTRWSDTSGPPEPPPLAPIEDRRDDKL